MNNITSGYIVTYKFKNEWIIARRARNHDSSLDRKEVFFTGSRIKSSLIESLNEAEEFSHLVSIKAAEIFGMSEPLPIQIDFYEKRGQKWVVAVAEDLSASI